MKYRKILILIAVITLLIVLLLKCCTDFHEDIMHLKSSNKEFKKKPENSIESTIMHREKEVYKHIFPSDD